MKVLAIFLLLIFPFLNGRAQVTIKGQVQGKDAEKLLASIYQFGSEIAGDFYGDFEINIDSLGGKYFFQALGYETQEVIITDTSFLTVTLKERKYNPRKLKRSMKRDERYRKKHKRQMRRGKAPITGGCCFVSGTKILMQDGSSENIENLVIGDTVLTYDFEAEKIIVSVIQDLDTVQHDNIIEIALEGDITLRNTDDHPYYVFGKGICSFNPQQTFANYGLKAEKIELGDQCYTLCSGELSLVKIVKITQVSGSFITYNIAELDNNNNYFVNGILVNNEKVKPALIEKIKSLLVLNL